MVKTRRPLLAAGGGDDSPPQADTEVGFAKLQGEDFEYYMQTYSIVLGRTSKKNPDAAADVDVDLGGLGGGMNVSRRHARIYYDFARRRFALEVLGKNGCLVENVLHVPGSTHVKLDSQDLLQMGDAQFYFLLPTRSIFDGVGGAVAGPRVSRMVMPRFEDGGESDDDEEEEEMEVRGRGKKRARGGGETTHLARKFEARSRVNRDADNQQLLRLEEKDVISSVATVLSDLCGPGEWMPMAQLHEELFEKYGTIWHHSRVRKYLTSEDWPESEVAGRPWFGLLTLLKKYSEHFVINTQKKGRVTTEFVSLVSLIS